MPTMNMPQPAARPGTALLLTGGGARAAYQVGVLQAIAALRRRSHPGQHGLPFDIVVGTSAGAINAMALACAADRFHHGVAQLARVWGHMGSHQVYRVDARDALRGGMHWLGLFMAGWWSGRQGRTLQPRSLLDNAPLRELLHEQLPLQRLPGLLAGGHLRAVALTSSCYSSDEHITFYDAAETQQDWSRVRRRALRTAITVDHVMASAAIPFLFPAARVEVEGHAGYYGDGSMRQLMPIAPAIHLGAQRVLAIGVGGAREAEGNGAASDPGYPSLAQVASHALSSVFLDTLAGDAEHLARLNHVLSLVEPERRARTGLQPIDLLVITPSRRLDDLATQHLDELPRSARALLAMLGMHRGAGGAHGAGLATYLLFESAFTQELMRLGRADAMAQSQAICRFFDWPERRR
ncbi:MAG: patatin-like phospholipase family protein [Proteobacteria bacterium]|nr:patatin-like phospholipase family protein [Pseudomonadota bacterium]